MRSRPNLVFMLAATFTGTGQAFPTATRKSIRSHPIRDDRQALSSSSAGEVTSVGAYNTLAYDPDFIATMVGPRHVSRLTVALRHRRWRSRRRRVRSPRPGPGVGCASPLH